MNNNYYNNDFDYENEKMRKIFITIWIVLAVVIISFLGVVLLILLKKDNNKNKSDTYMRNATVMNNTEKTKETESTTTKNKDLKYAKIYGEESESTNSNINNSTTNNTNAITSNDYILSGSDRKFLTKDDLKNLNADTCRLARNELYARHGRMFDDAVLQNYFNSKTWYRGTIKPEDFTESMLNSYEIYNRDLIVEYEKEKGYR